MEKRVVLVSAAVAVLGAAAAVLGFVAEGTKSKAFVGFDRQRCVYRRTPALVFGVMPARYRLQAVDRRLGASGGGGGDVPLRRGDEPGRDAGPLHEQAGPVLPPRLLLRLRRAQERHLLHGLHPVRRRRRVRGRRLRLPPSDGRAGPAGPVRRAGSRDGAAAVGAAVPAAAVPATHGLPCSSPVRRVRRQATCGDSLTLTSAPAHRVRSRNV